MKKKQFLLRRIQDLLGKKGDTTNIAVIEGETPSIIAAEIIANPCDL